MGIGQQDARVGMPTQAVNFFHRRNVTDPQRFDGALVQIAQ